MACGYWVGVVADAKQGAVMANPDRVEALKQRKAKIEQQLALIEAREKAKARKEDTRLKVLIGAGIMADAKIHPEIVDRIQEILDRATSAKRDRELLKAKGWLPGRSS